MVDATEHLNSIICFDRVYIYFYILPQNSFPFDWQICWFQLGYQWYSLLLSIGLLSIFDSYQCVVSLQSFSHCIRSSVPDRILHKLESCVSSVKRSATISSHDYWPTEIILILVSDHKYDFSWYVISTIAFYWQLQQVTSMERSNIVMKLLVEIIKTIIYFDIWISTVQNISNFF